MKTLRTSEFKKSHETILRALYRFQVLTTDLVVRAVGSVGAASTVRANIAWLANKDNDYIARFKLSTGGNGPAICVLSEQGMKYLRDELGYDMRFYKPPSHWKGMSSEYHMHPLELNKFIIAASKITEFDKRITLTSWQRDYEIQPNPLRAKEPYTGIEHVVVPDAVLQFGVQLPTGLKRRIIFVELERNTHKRKAFEDKIRGLFFVAGTGVFEDRYNHPLPRIALVSTVSDEHVSWMKEQTEAILQQSYPELRPGEQIKPDSRFNVMFHLQKVPSLLDGDIDVSSTFITHSWLHPIGEELYSLLDI
jgi:hypothetical protein